MSKEERRTVWVLGAGFSKSLGGPLLNQVFTDRSRRQLASHFPDADRLRDPAANTVRKIYEYGTSVDRNYWGDPEEFLDMVDTAAGHGPDSASWKFIEDMIGDKKVTVENLYHSGRRLLAAVCSAF